MTSPRIGSLTLALVQAVLAAGGQPTPPPAHSVVVVETADGARLVGTNDATVPGRMRGDVCAVPPESLRHDPSVNEITLDGLGAWDLRS